MKRRSTRGKKAVLFWAFATLVGAGLIGLTLAGMAYRWTPTIPDGRPGRLVEVEGTRLRVLQVGSGPDLLLIHGSPGLIEDWSPILDRLATRYRITAYDRPARDSARSGATNIGLNGMQISRWPSFRRSSFIRLSSVIPSAPRRRWRSQSGTGRRSQAMCWSALSPMSTARSIRSRA